MLEGKEGMLLTLTEAARRHGIPKHRLQAAVHDGRLPARRAGRDTWVRAADVEAYLARVAAWWHGKRTGRPRRRSAPEGKQPSA